LAVLFAITLLLSAGLLFLVQPMVAKMVLPMLGGTPMVWITCMVFFQAALLAGYSYAHALTSCLTRKGQALTHAGLMAVAVLVLPFAIGGYTPPSPARTPVLWLLMLLVTTVGLPFFAVSTNAPILQRWFATSGHRLAKDFLYSISNFGSVLGLLSYPVLVEPHLRLAHQSRLWAAGYAVLVLLVSSCAFTVWKSSPDIVRAEVQSEPNRRRHGSRAAIVSAPAPSR